MNIFEKIWSVRQASDTSDQLASVLGVTPLVSQILSTRGISEEEHARKFLYATLGDLYDPFLLEGMQVAVKRIREAVKRQERIVIYGDYDVDGITSISVLLKYFKHIGYPVQYYIPNRLEEGYGLNEEAIVRIAEDGTDLLITVDCGITSVHEAQVAKSVGLDLIITDHHECQSELPACLAIINPKQENCSYPYTMLAGVGLAFKLIQGLMGDDFDRFLDQVIDIVALGTVADVAPISDENRIITKFGLKQLNDTNNPGLKALIDVSGVSGKSLNTGHIGFTLAPRINAAGRIGTPQLGVELLTTDSSTDAMRLASELNTLNEKRQAIEKSILEEADAYIKENVNTSDELVLVISGENWHTGIIGIVASRIAEKYYRPTIILNVEDGVAKGSARSIGHFSIFDAMFSCKDLFTKFGGHEQAAGVTLPAENVQTFRERVNQFAKEILTERDLIPVLKVDGRIHGRDISYKLLEELELLQPFGLSNPKPQFVIEDLQVDKVMMLGKEKNHLKMIVHDQNRVFDSLCFGCHDKYDFIQTKDKVDMVAGLDKNSFRGVETIQLMIKDLRKYSGDNPAYNLLKHYYELSLAKYFEHKALNESKTRERSAFSIAEMKPNAFKHVPDNGRCLVIIETLSDLYTFIKTYHDDSSYKYTLHFNEITHPSNFDVVVHPLHSTDLIENYDNQYIFCPENAYKESEKIKNDLLPDRDALVVLYKAVMVSQTLHESLENLASRTKLSVGALVLSGLVLKDIGLIKFEISNGEIDAELYPKPKEKIDIFDNPTFKMLQAYRTRKFESLIWFGN